MGNCRIVGTRDRSQKIGTSSARHAGYREIYRNRTSVRDNESGRSVLQRMVAPKMMLRNPVGFMHTTACRTLTYYQVVVDRSRFLRRLSPPRSLTRSQNPWDVVWAVGCLFELQCRCDRKNTSFLIAEKHTKMTYFGLLQKLKTQRDRPREKERVESESGVCSTKQKRRTWSGANECCTAVIVSRAENGSPSVI